MTNPPRQGLLTDSSSAGVGRTGTFIALASLLAPKSGAFEIENTKPWPDKLASDKVARTVDQLREWRAGLVQTPEQLFLIYHMVEGE